MKNRTSLASFAALAAIAVSGAAVASAQSTLEIVKERGNLRCHRFACSLGSPSLARQCCRLLMAKASKVRFLNMLEYRVEKWR